MISQGGYFEWLKKIGVYGIKVDFFESDKQNIMNYYIDILEDAADYQLMVNFHGSTVPRGWSRTYPHLMSMEAVFAAMGGVMFLNESLPMRGWIGCALMMTGMLLSQIPLPRLNRVTN